MKLMKMLSLLTALLMAALPLCAAAEESEADTLLLGELTEWAERYKMRALSSEPLNDPKASLTEEGYEFIYDFATLYADQSVMKADTVVSAVVVTSPEEEGPRGVKVDDTLTVATAAFYNENAQLRGSRDSALLYLIDLLPESLQWAEIQRDGQRVETIQYAVHDQQTTGGDGYTDAGLILTMQDGTVSAIRVYGLDSRITFDEVHEVCSRMRAAAMADDYQQVPFSYDGASLAKFSGEDLVFSGMEFTALTPDYAAMMLGEPLSDSWVQDGDTTIRTMTFSDCELTFLEGADGKPRIYMFLLTSGGVEGPRAVRVGDTFSEVFNRFRNGEGAFDGVSREVLYGSEESGEFGVAEYGSDASVTLRYGLVLEEGERVVLHMTFTEMVLSEVMLYMAQ
ncbi:MAG: hypothetical protein IJ343_09110 [Clostridia bacterium]|nr:hypothetical protein [Clostridia bacterium]